LTNQEEAKMTQETQGKTEKGNINKEKNQQQPIQLLSPKAGILDQARRRPLAISAKQEELVINTLINLKTRAKPTTRSKAYPIT
jgi:hypothetical protein